MAKLSMRDTSRQLRKLSEGASGRAAMDALDRSTVLCMGRLIDWKVVR